MTPEEVEKRFQRIEALLDNTAAQHEQHMIDYNTRIVELEEARKEHEETHATLEASQAVLAESIVSVANSLADLKVQVAATTTNVDRLAVRFDKWLERNSNGGNA